VVGSTLCLDDCHDSESRKKYLDDCFIPNDSIDPKITDGFAVSVRFCISRAYIEHDFAKITRAVRVSRDIWRLTTEVGEVYVLEANGESLGKELRQDWADWAGKEQTKTLESTIRTKELYEYPEGIARGFKGDRVIARRAVLAGCHGEW
jgi:hypothetical protein